MDADTLKAYVKLVSHGKPVGVREFQRLMGYRSPGKAKRVLDKLVREGLAVKTDEGYAPSKDMPPLLTAYTIVKGLVVPRIVVYSAFSFAFAAAYILLAKVDIITAVALLIPPSIMAAEGARLWLNLRRVLGAQQQSSPLRQEAK